MSDRLALANAIEDAGIPRDKAQRVASVIFDAIHNNVATKANVQAVRTDMQAAVQAVRNDMQAGTRRTSSSTGCWPGWAGWPWCCPAPSSPPCTTGRLTDEPQAPCPHAVTSPLLRLFAVFWWLLVIGCAGLALYDAVGVWKAYNNPSWEWVAMGAGEAPPHALARATSPEGEGQQCRFWRESGIQRTYLPYSLCRAQQGIGQTCVAALMNALVTEQPKQVVTATADRACHTEHRTFSRDLPS
jgi:hypothetical protein